MTTTLRRLRAALMVACLALASFALAGLALTSSALAAAAPAHVGPYEDALQGFTTDDFTDTVDAINALAASGDARAPGVLQALQDGALIYSADAKKVFVKGADGKLTDAVTGAVAETEPSDADTVRLNNRVRSVLGAALGGLSLMAKEPQKRLDAANSVFKSRDDNALPLLDKALDAETVTAVRRAMEAAKAAIEFSSTDASLDARVAAVATLRDRGGQDALALLTSLPADAPAGLRKAAADAIRSIERTQTVWAAVQNAWYGLSLGSVLLLAAIGLAITFGVMGVINMAHGEMVMLGAYVTFVVQQLIRAYSPALFDLSLLIALPAAFIVAGGVGIVVERTIIRFLYGRPLETLLATWGLSLMLQQAVRTAFGPTNKDVGNPSWMSGAFQIGEMTITYNRLWIIVFAAVVFLALLAMLRFTRLGLEMRAVTQNRAMAASMGIRTARIDALTFGLGSGIAGIAGVALSQIDNVSPNLGQGYIIDSFLVVVFGGVGNLWGTLLGALMLGVANKFLEPVAGAVLGKIAILVLIILFIQKRPRGMFALKGRAIEA